MDKLNPRQKGEAPRINVRLPRLLVEALEREAKARGVRLSDLVRDILSAWQSKGGR